MEQLNQKFQSWNFTFCCPLFCINTNASLLKAAGVRMSSLSNPFQKDAQKLQRFFPAFSKLLHAEGAADESQQAALRGEHQGDVQRCGGTDRRSDRGSHSRPSRPTPSPGPHPARRRPSRTVVAALCRLPPPRPAAGAASAGEAATRRPRKMPAPLLLKGAARTTPLPPESCSRCPPPRPPSRAPALPTPSSPVPRSSATRLFL